MGKSELQYPHIRTNIELCRKQLYALCRGERSQTAVMSVPPQEENERLHTALQDVMLALKGQEHTRPERAEAVRIAEKELARAEKSLAGAKKRGAPDKDVENLEKKVAYKRLVAVLVKGTGV